MEPFVTLTWPAGHSTYFKHSADDLIHATSVTGDGSPDWDAATVVDREYVDNITAFTAITTLVSYLNGDLSASVTPSDNLLVAKIHGILSKGRTDSLDDVLDTITALRATFADAGMPIVGRKRDDERDDDLNLNAIVNTARTLGVTCELVPGGGNTAYIEAQGWDRKVHAGGGGYWRTLGWAAAHRIDFEVSLLDAPDLPDATYRLPDGATEADAATMIANLVAGREPLTDDGRVKPPPLQWTRQHDYDYGDQVAESTVVPPDCETARYLVGPDGDRWAVVLITTGPGRRGALGHLQLGDYATCAAAKEGAQAYEDVAHKYGFPRTEAALAAKRDQQ